MEVASVNHSNSNTISLRSRTTVLSQPSFQPINAAHFNIKWWLSIVALIFPPPYTIGDWRKIIPGTKLPPFTSKLIKNRHGITRFNKDKGLFQTRYILTLQCWTSSKSNPWLMILTGIYNNNVVYYITCVASATIGPEYKIKHVCRAGNDFAGSAKIFVLFVYIIFFYNTQILWFIKK